MDFALGLVCGALLVSSLVFGILGLGYWIVLKLVRAIGHQITG